MFHSGMGGKLPLIAVNFLAVLLAALQLRSLGI
jgi:hypothetical protein